MYLRQTSTIYRDLGLLLGHLHQSTFALASDEPYTGIYDCLGNSRETSEWLYISIIIYTDLHILVNSAGSPWVPEGRPRPIRITRALAYEYYVSNNLTLCASFDSSEVNLPILVVILDCTEAYSSQRKLGGREGNTHNSVEKRALKKGPQINEIEQNSSRKVLVEGTHLTVHIIYHR